MQMVTLTLSQHLPDLALCSSTKARQQLLLVSDLAQSKLNYCVSSIIIACLGICVHTACHVLMLKGLGQSKHILSCHFYTDEWCSRRHTKCKLWKEEK